MGNLGTNLATGLATNVATNLAGGAQLPETLGALLHYDPHVTANVDIGTGVSDYRPVVGSQTLDVLSNATGSKQPTYNTPSPTLASGRNTMTFDASALQSLFNTSMTSVSVLDSENPWTMCANVVYVDVTLGGAIASVWQQASNLNYVTYYNYAGVNAGRLAGRYRSTAAFFENLNVATDRFVNATPAWAIIDFDGDNSVSVQKKGGARRTTTGANTVTGVALDSLSLGGYVSQGHFDGEIGDYALFDRKLDATDRAAMITWLDGRL